MSSSAQTQHGGSSFFTRHHILETNPLLLVVGTIGGAWVPAAQSGAK